jgi:hypothetical protein
VFSPDIMDSIQRYNIGTPHSMLYYMISMQRTWSHGIYLQLTVSTGIYFVQIRPSRALDARLEEAGPLPEGEEE